METQVDKVLAQKFSLRNYRVLFNIQDSLAAEEILDCLDRATPGIKETFGCDTEPAVDFFVCGDDDQIRGGTGRAFRADETSRIDYQDARVTWFLPRVPPPFGERAVRELGYLLFNTLSGEREATTNRWRAPAWLREGLCQQESVRVRPDSAEALRKGWAMVQAAVAEGRLFRPGMMPANLGTIPDADRRAMAFSQAFFQVRHLNSIHPDRFFMKYATLMRAISDLEANDALRRITGFDSEKLFGLFQEWIQTTSLDGTPA